MTDVIPVRPSRTFTFTATPPATVHWEDVFYDKFARQNVRIISKTLPVTQVWPLPIITFFEEHTAQNGTVSQIEHHIDYGAAFAGASSFGPGNLTLTATFTFIASKEVKINGKSVIVGQPETESTSASIDIARRFVDAGSPNFDPIMNVGATPKLVVTVDGDYRRPALAHSTRILSDDELWKVGKTALRVDLNGPQLFAILYELTGARRTAFHSDGFYGASSLTPAQMQAAGMPAVPGMTLAEQFMADSARKQIDIAGDYLASQKVSGLIPVFTALATGRLNPTATTGVIVPAPLPARLKPFSGDGNVITADDITRRLNARVQEVTAEFERRVPFDVQVIPFLQLNKVIV